jgi:glycosyltransferase involved in cell wall biosynthesis
MQPSDAPKVSILVPSFNEAPATITESLLAIRNQTFRDFECLVIDESTDPAKAAAIQTECALDPRFRYIHPDSRLGLAGSLNLGLATANGALIARCDADDVCLPNRLDLQVQFLQEHPNIGILGGTMDIIDETGRTTGHRGYPLKHDDIARTMMLTNAMAHPTVMFRRDLPERFGPYDPTFRFSEDLELWLRWLNAGVRFANLPQTLLKYRQQVTTRSIDHWRFNLLARRRHYSTHHLVLRTAGIAGIAIWSRIPKLLQERLFRAVMFTRK